MDTGFSAEVQVLDQHQAALCKVFSSAQRVLILWFLTDKERTVSEIALALGASLPSTSQYLRLMELSNILESRRDGHNIYYCLAENKMLKNRLVLADAPNNLAKEMPVKRFRKMEALG